MTEWFKYPISRDSLPKDQVYPLTPMEVQKLLAQNQILRVHSVALLPRVRKEDFIKACYLGENARQEPISSERHPDAGSTSIWIFGISKQNRQEACDLIRGQVLPRLVEWLRDIEQREHNWRLSNHNIRFRYDRGEIRVSLDEDVLYC